MIGAHGRPQPDLVEWMTLVARHTKPAGAPGPLAHDVPARWQRTGRLVLTGQEDCFLPPGRLSRAVEERLGVPLGVLAGLGHLSVDDDPSGLGRVILGRLKESGPVVIERATGSSR
jgi:hypothetical protein